MRWSRLRAAARVVSSLLLLLPGASRAQTAVPTITAYQLTTGATITSATPGTQLVIKGANLGSSGTLKFNNVTLTYNAWAPTYIRVVVPSIPGLPITAPFTATTAGQTAVGPPFTIIGSGSPPPAPPAVTGYQTTGGSAISSAAPGTSVVIIGANLGTSGTVTFNGISAATSSWTATAIIATVPTAASYPSAGPVVVSTGGQTATGPSFTITAPPPPPPSVTGYQTTGGAALSSAIPGAQVVIVGTNFGSGGSVQFNGISASTSAWSATAITATVPAPPSFPNTGAVSVTTGGQTGTGPSFTITAPPPPPPSITDYQTTGGASITSAIPGTPVVIVGTNFGSTGTVQFNGITATASIWTATAITVTVPTAPSYPSAGTVSVSTGGQSASGPTFTITAPPPPPAPAVSGYQTTTGTAITSGTPGSQIVITGSNFGASGTVQFNGITATTSAWSASSITATVPAAVSYPSSGPVSVTSGGQTGTGPSFTITAPPPPAPTITGYQTALGSAISSAAPGTQVVIVGNNLGASGTVTFNGISASTSSWTATAITATVPTAASYPSAGPVAATTGGQTAAGPSFTITPPPPPPAITGYQTTTGAAISSAIPGTQVVIVGTNFGSSGTVQFNGLAASASAWSATAVTATVPTPGSFPNTGAVTVTSGGQTGTGPNFTITAPPPPSPSITGYQTAGGTSISTAAAGTPVVIVGANLGSSGTVTFNGISAATSSWTATAISVTVPAAPGYPSTGPIVVTTGGQTATGANFTITAPAPPPPGPTITGYQLTTGVAINSAQPGAQIVILGANLGSSGTLKFNGTTLSYNAWTATYIRVVVPTRPSYPVTAPFTATTGGQTATGPAFTINAPGQPPPPPAITGYQTPAGVPITSAPPGTQIVILGTNLGPSGSVKFNGLSASTSAWSSTAITAIVPNPGSFPGTGPVTVATGGLTGTGPAFSITAPPPPPPAITGYQTTGGTPILSAVPGSLMVIVGSNLGTSGTVKFNGIAATPSAWSAGAITVTVPAAPLYPDSGPVTVTTGGQTATGSTFTINAPPPSVTGYQTTGGASIASATPGTQVVIVGTNLGSAGTVQFNGITATTSSWTGTAITATVPTAPSYPSAGPVSVTTGGQSASGPTFTITAPPPPPPAITGYQTIGGSAISSAPPGTSVVILGTNLGSAGTLIFNGLTAATASWTATAITATVPAAASYPSTGPVVVTTGGQSATGSSFTITAPPPPPPSITGYQTTGGSAISSAPPGTPVVIVGTNLGSAGTVTFNGISAATSSWTATAITATVPAAASYPNTGPVVVTTGGQTATGTDFTITAPPPAPLITDYQTTGGVSITSAPAGTSVVVVGSNFGSLGVVQFNGAAATTTAWSDTAITAIVPAAASYPAAGPVTVTVSGQTATGADFTITAPPPTISGYQTPGGVPITSAPPGTQVVIVGTNLGTLGVVQFNGNSAVPASWTATAITVTVPAPGSFPDAGPVVVTVGGQTATGPTFTIVAPVPTITGYQATTGASITSAPAGSTVVIAGANLGSSGTVQFNGITAATTTWTAGAITATVPAAAAYPSTGPVTVTIGSSTAAGADFTIAPPLAVTVHDVVAYGAKGDGATDDRAAIQQAIDAAVPGDSVYFPPGSYRISSSLRVLISNLRVYGSGDTSRIIGPTDHGDIFQVYNSAAQLSGLQLDHLQIVGAAIFDKDLNTGAGIELIGATATQVSSCTFDGCGVGVSDGPNTTGTTVSNCHITNWGRVGVFFNSGASVLSTMFDQHDPNAQDQVTSHGVYIHSGADNCVVQGCTFSGVRYYGIQIYGQTADTTMNNIQIIGNQFMDNAQDITVQSAGPTIAGVTITGNRFSRTHGYSVTVKSGTGIHVDNNQFYDTSNGAVVFGTWAPYDAGATLSNVSADGNTYTQISSSAPQYIFYAEGVNGTLSNVSFQGNTAQGVHENGIVQSAAIYLSQVAGANVGNNTLMMAAGAGTNAVCSGIQTSTGCSGIQVFNNTVNGTSAPLAYGFNGTGLSPTSSVTNNQFNHCKLQPGGAAASGNIVTP